VKPAPVWGSRSRHVSIGFTANFGRLGLENRASFRNIKHKPRHEDIN